MGAMPMDGAMRPGSATAFIGMWVAMMAAMMLPSLVPTLWRYRRALRRSGRTSPATVVALVAVGYFAVWTGVAVAIYPLDFSLAALANVAPVVAGMIVVASGALQFTGWKARQLECCQLGAGHGGTQIIGAGAALRRGLRLGLHCSCSCAGYTAALLVVGDMSVRAMLIATVAITLERLAPGGVRIARLFGGVAVCAGVYLMVLAA